MPAIDDYPWINWINELQSIYQAGLTYCNDPFCKKRYEAIKKIVAEISAKHSLIETEEIFQFLDLESGYLTPKLDVRGAVFKNDKILLVQEKDDGLWALPGGWADINESPSQAIRREIYEESGYHVTILKLAALLDKRKYNHPVLLPHAYKCFFIGTIESFDPVLDIDIIKADFFAKNNLPPLSQDRVLASQINRMFEHYAHPELPTDFD